MDQDFLIVVSFLGGSLCFLGGPLVLLFLILLVVFRKNAERMRSGDLKHPSLKQPTEAFLNDAQRGLASFEWEALAQDDATLVMKGRRFADNWHYRGEVLLGDTPWLAYNLRNQRGTARLEVRSATQRMLLEIDCRPFQQASAVVSMNDAAIGRLQTESQRITMTDPEGVTLATLQRVKPLSVNRVTSGLRPGAVQRGERVLGALNGFVTTKPHWVTVPTLEGALLKDIAHDLQERDADCLMAFIAFDIFRRIEDVLFYSK